MKDLPILSNTKKDGHCYNNAQNTKTYTIKGDDRLMQP